MKNKREVGEEEARIFAEERNMPYFEASAKEDQNIQNVFYLLAHELKKVRNGQKVSFVMFGSSPIQPKNSQNTCW